jgi:membrane-associated phospholipid phosphatase
VPDQNIAAELAELDVNLFESVAEFHAPVLDTVIPGLSQAANYSRLWITAAAALALTGGARGRRVAATGLIAIGVTSLVANAVVKPLLPRRRPESSVPERRRLVQPTSTSFPSGHTASAAAFSAVIGAEYPLLKVPFDVAAMAVGFSRVYTGVHYPGDVVVGWMLGRVLARAVRMSTPTVWAMNGRA